jgi:hypothetical protein
MRNIDTVPALLSTEEHVMNRGAVDLLGGKNLAQANIVGRQIMDSNPKRYNDPNGINQNVPVKLAGGTVNAGGLNVQDRFPKRFKAYADAYNSRQNDPAYLNYLNKNAGGDANKADEAYMKYLKEKNFHPGDLQKYQNGTMNAGGIPRLGAPFDKGNTIYSKESMGNMPGLAGVVKNGNSYSQARGFVPTDTVRTPTGIYPIRGYENGTLNEEGIQTPGIMDTIRGMINAGQEQQQGLPQPPQQGYIPTIDEARKNYELQPGANPPVQTVQRFENGGIVKTPEEAQRELEAVEAMRRVPFVRQPVQQEQPNLLSEAGRSIGNVLSDYADRFNQGVMPKQQAANVAAQPSVQPTQPKTQTPTLGESNIDMNAIPSRVSDAGLPYNNVGSTVNFTNPDGTGRGTISERMPVNGGLAARMNDGKGSFSVMKLESPYGPGGRPQPVEQQQSYQPSQSEDYSGYISDLMTRLDMNQPDGKFDSVGTLIGKKQKNRQIQSQIDLLNGIQNTGNQAAIARDRMGLDQNQFNQGMGLNRQKLALDQQQQQFDNKLGLANIGINSQKAQADLAMANEKLMIDRLKTAPAQYQGMLLESLSKRLAAGQQDTPEYQSQLKLYQMAFGKNPIDDLMGAVAPQQ